VLKKLFLLLPLLCSLAYGQSEICGSIYVPERVGKVDIRYDDKEFYAENEDGVHKIQRCFIDKELRGITPERLQKFLEVGYIDVNKCGNDTYSLRACPRLKGGGPILAAIVYGAVKGVAYGTIAAGIITGIRKGAHSGSRAPKPVPDTGIEGSAIGVGIGVLGRAVSKSAGNVSHIAGPVADGLRGTQAGREVSQAVVGAAMAPIASGTVTVGGVVGAIETVATAASTWALTLPTP
jgi:hypothetical protein